MFFAAVFATVTMSLLQQPSQRQPVRAPRKQERQWESLMGKKP
jgi:hypothetical protein